MADPWDRISALYRASKYGDLDAAKAELAKGGLPLDATDRVRVRSLFNVYTVYTLNVAF